MEEEEKEAEMKKKKGEKNGQWRKKIKKRQRRLF